MAAIAGRKLSVKKNNGTIAKVRSKQITINNEPIDITSDDDAGWRKLLADPASRSVDISFEGVFDSTALILIAASATATAPLLTDITVVIEGIGTFSGDFHLSTVGLSGDYKDATIQSGSLASSGAITFTPA